PARQRCGGSHGGVRAPRPRLADVPHARWRGDGLLGCQPENLGRRLELPRGGRGGHSRGPPRRCPGSLDRARASAAGGAVVIKLNTILPLAAVAACFAAPAFAQNTASSLTELLDNVQNVRT